MPPISCEYLRDTGEYSRWLSAHAERYEVLDVIPVPTKEFPERLFVKYRKKIMRETVEAMSFRGGAV